MDLQVRSIPHGSWIAVETESVSCTYNLEGFSPMATVVQVLGFDRSRLTSDYQLKKSHDENFIVHAHLNSSPVLLTTSKTRSWDDATAATTEITKVADREGCRSLCMTHFMFIPGKFPGEDFYYCLEMASISSYRERLRKVIVDVDDRHFEAANKLLGKVRSHQDYAKRFDLSLSE